MGDLTAQDIRSFFVVAAALIAFLMLVWNLLDKIKASRKPQHDLAAWQRETEIKLANDRRRLDSLEEGNKAICTGLLAIMQHEISGNDISKLESARDVITQYLINR